MTNNMAEHIGGMTRHKSSWMDLFHLFCPCKEWNEPQSQSGAAQCLSLATHFLAISASGKRTCHPKTTM